MEKKFTYRLNEVPRPHATAIDYRADLNDEQYAVVTKSEGPCLVLAGAGSGKTRTLIYRVAYLIEGGVDPSNILLVTFTNKAARNMQDRLELLLKHTPKGLWSGTFHHIGNRCLRLYAKEIGYTDDFGILDAEDSQDLIKACIKSMNVRAGAERFPKPGIIQAIISYAVNSRTDITAVLEKNYPYFAQLEGSIRKIKELYELRKKQSNTMDYDDLLSKWLYLLENVPRAAERFSKGFRYILVDEYQDTNVIQARVIERLAQEHRNVLVVGDDAQAIYSFRAATIKNILQFPKTYADATVFRLETNYRSSPEILALANDSIAHNNDQFEKHLKAVNAPLNKPVVVEPRDLYFQASFVAQRVLELRDEGIDLSSIAVLFRAHYQSAELEMELLKREIPYVVRGGVRFFEQAHIKDVLSFLRIAANPFDEISWLRALALQPGIGMGYADRLFKEFVDAKRPVEFVVSADFGKTVPERTKGGLLHFKKMMRPLLSGDGKRTPEEAIGSILKSGYETYVLANFENAKDRIEDLRELVNFAHGYRSIKSFLTDVTLRESFKGETLEGSPSNDECLILSTIHQAKGLEWSAVFVLGLCENQFPHPKSMENRSELEEERRLFYVAATRSKKHLYLCHPLTRYDHQMGTVIARRSLFLEELSPELYDSWDLEGPSAGGGEDAAIDRIIRLDYEPLDDIE